MIKGKVKISICIITAMALIMAGCAKGNSTSESEVKDDIINVDEEFGSTSEPPEDESAAEEDDLHDLAELYGADEEAVLHTFPDAEKVGDGEDMFYQMSSEVNEDYSMAGPFFYFDNSGHVNNIQYSGTEYSLGSIRKGIDYTDALPLLEADGWEFFDASIEHGTAYYYALFRKGDKEFFIGLDEEGDIGALGKEDLKGNVNRMGMYLAEE